MSRPTPEMLRFQKFYDCIITRTSIYEDSSEVCCICGEKIDRGIHDLVRNLIYCNRLECEDITGGGW
jgi:hypothetical protein